MAAPICTTTSITTGIACFKNFESEQRKSILIYFNTLELNAIGGTNYIEELGSGGELMDDATCYIPLEIETCPPAPEYLLLAYNNAVNAGASPVSTSVLLAAAIACNKNFTPAQHDAQMFLLACQLGTHKAYPQ